MRKSTKKSADSISRRTVLRGAGVTMALPWMESLPCFAGTTSPECVPEAVCGSVHGQRSQRGSLGLRGVGRRA